MSGLFYPCSLSLLEKEKIRKGQADQGAGPGRRRARPTFTADQPVVGVSDKGAGGQNKPA